MGLIPASTCNPHFPQSTNRSELQPRSKVEREFRWIALHWSLHLIYLKFENPIFAVHGRHSSQIPPLVMVMVIFSALVRSPVPPIYLTGSFGLVRPAWIKYTRYCTW